MAEQVGGRPPGDAAKSITPTASNGLRSKISTRPNAMVGRRKSCRINATTTALGSRPIRRKSPRVSVRPSPNMMIAKAIGSPAVIRPVEFIDSHSSSQAADGVGTEGADPIGDLEMHITFGSECDLGQQGGHENVSDSSTNRHVRRSTVNRRTWRSGDIPLRGFGQASSAADRPAIRPEKMHPPRNVPSRALYPCSPPPPNPAASPAA